jgi:NhaP-type Na+/H+ or K+/H+ antiporter
MTVIKTFMEGTTYVSETILGKSVFVAGFLVVFICQLIMGYVNVGTENENATYKYTQNINTATVFILFILGFLGIYVPLFINASKHTKSFSSFLDFVKPYVLYNFGVIVLLYIINAFMSTKGDMALAVEIGKDTRHDPLRSKLATFGDVLINTVTQVLNTTTLLGIAGQNKVPVDLTYVIPAFVVAYALK